MRGKSTPIRQVFDTVRISSLPKAERIERIRRSCSPNGEPLLANQDYAGVLPAIGKPFFMPRLHIFIADLGTGATRQLTTGVSYNQDGAGPTGSFAFEELAQNGVRREQFLTRIVGARRPLFAFEEPTRKCCFYSDLDGRLHRNKFVAA